MEALSDLAEVELTRIRNCHSRGRMAFATVEEKGRHLNRLLALNKATRLSEVTTDALEGVM